MPPGPVPEGAEYPLWDEDGDPTCPHCGSKGIHQGFVGTDGKPRVRFHCSVGTYPECERERKISCSHDFTALVPLGRNSDAYTATAMSHKNSERVHKDMRARYRVGGKDLSGRIKRIGQGARQLRADAAVLLEWVMFTIRMGWTGLPRVIGLPTRPSADKLQSVREKHRRGNSAKRSPRKKSRRTRAPDPPG